MRTASPLLLIGASGFAGRHFAHAARAAGLEVVGTSRSGGEDLVCDLLDPGSIEKALSETSPAVVVNLAGEASVSRSWRDPSGTFLANAMGTLNLLEAVCARAPDALVLCVSSGEVYGGVPSDQQPVTEDSEVRPLSPYGASKASMELICGQYAASRELRMLVFRAFNHFGPGQSDAFAASDFAHQVALAERDGADEALLGVGNIEARRDFTDVRDMVRAYLGGVESGLTGTYNACSGSAVAIRTLIDLMGQATELPIRVEVESRSLRSSDQPVLYGSADRLRAEIDWAPAIPPERTVADLLDWWRAKLSDE
jgi:GDP-4-dehydro-6-deoxy-D-mannose reductase